MTTHLTAPTRRPALVVALVALRVVNLLLGLLTAFLLLSSGAADVMVIGSIITTVCVLGVISTIGLWMLRRWARLLALALIAFTVPFGILGIVMSGGRDPGTYLGLAADLFAVYVLLQPHIKQRFS